MAPRRIACRAVSNACWISRSEGPPHASVTVAISPWTISARRMAGRYGDQPPFTSISGPAAYPPPSEPSSRRISVRRREPSLIEDLAEENLAEVLDDHHVIADDVGARILVALPLDPGGERRMDLLAVLQGPTAAHQQLLAVLLHERRPARAAQDFRVRIVLVEGAGVEDDPQSEAVDGQAFECHLADRNRRFEAEAAGTRRAKLGHHSADREAFLGADREPFDFGPDARRGHERLFLHLAVCQRDHFLAVVELAFGERRGRVETQVALEILRGSPERRDRAAADDRQATRPRHFQEDIVGPDEAAAEGGSVAAKHEPASQWQTGGLCGLWHGQRQRLSGRRRRIGTLRSSGHQSRPGRQDCIAWTGSVSRLGRGGAAGCRRAEC